MLQMSQLPCLSPFLSVQLGSLLANLFFLECSNLVLLVESTLNVFRETSPVPSYPPICLLWLLFSPLTSPFAYKTHLPFHLSLKSNKSLP